jgi:hypothetical protein
MLWLAVRAKISLSSGCVHSTFAVSAGNVVVTGAS